MVYGFVKIANETMARPIRTLTEARGFATSKHMYVYLYPFLSLTRSAVDKWRQDIPVELAELTGSLASFGGAGGQHACEIAEVRLFICLIPCNV